MTKQSKGQQDKVMVMVHVDGTGSILGFVDGSAIVYRNASKAQVRWYTEQPVVNSKGHVVPVEVII